MAAMRDCRQIMGYINPDPVPGAGLFASPAGTYTPEEYKASRRGFVDNKEIGFTDARTGLPGGLQTFKLETHAMQVFTPPVFTAPTEDRFGKASYKAVKEAYYPKLAPVVKELTGAKDVFLLSHLLRDEAPGNDSNRAYSRFAHTDAAWGSAPGWRQTLKKRGVPEEEADTCDIAMLNVWFPMDRPAYQDPLCLLDPASVELPSGLKNVAYVYGKGYVPTEKDFGGPEGKSNLYGPMYDPKHKWYFISDQKPEEAWIFKQYDTRNDGQPKMAFHNSFHDPFHEDKPKETHGRRSAEFRMLVTFPTKCNENGTQFGASTAKL